MIFYCPSVLVWVSIFSYSPVNAQVSQSNEAEKILKHLDIFLTNPAYRDRDEGVSFSGDTAEIWFLESLRYGDLDQKICDGAKWLITGRLKESEGAKAVFFDLPSIQG